MDVIYSLGEASANEIQAGMTEAPSNTAVRTHLRIMEEKGLLTHRQVGKRFVYRPKKSKLRTGRSALERVLKVYFGDSLQKAVSAHLADPNADISQSELDALDELIRQAKEQRTPE